MFTLVLSALPASCCSPRLAPLGALRATGAHPQPSLALLAYAAASIVALIPLTPGGIGIVEASLASLLVLAGAPSSSAFVATLAYRLFAYWLPVLATDPAYLMFRRRYGAAWRRSSGHRADK